MPQNIEKDFLKAAQKLKQKNKRILWQRICAFLFLAMTIAAGVIYLQFKDKISFRINDIDPNLKILLISIVGLVLVFGLAVYFINLQAASKKNSHKKSPFVSSKYLLIFSLLLIVIIHQTGLLTRLLYNPQPPLLTSPWPWQNQETIHPVVASLTPEIEKNIKSVAEYIAQKESDPYLRVKALHDYVINRVTYDLDVLKGTTGVRPSQDAQTVFSTRKAVCEGYANLFTALGRAIGINVVVIEGDIRQDLAPLDVIPEISRLLDSNYNWTRHAWNAVKVSDNWQLVDTTWDDSDLNQYRSDYLMPPPKVIAISHFPEYSGWQLLDSLKDKISFEKQLILTPKFFTEGLEVISPTDYNANVTKTSLIEIKKPTNYQNKILAKFEKGKDSGFSLKSENSFTSQNKNDLKECQTQQNEGEMITISCQFSGTGDYQVHLVSLKQENNNSKKAFIYLGKLRFRVI